MTVYFMAPAQELLQRKIDIEAEHRPVAEVLKMAEQQAGFYFSYNNRIVPGDSLVSVHLKQRPVSELLAMLLGNRFRYEENNGHLIIQPSVPAPYWYISGMVVDQATGEPVGYATVYERQQLVGTMTDDRGRFRLQLKERRSQASISISKVSYADTVVVLPEAEPQELRLSIAQISYTLDSVTISGVERNWLASLMLSSRQTMNSLNLSGFLARQPFQVSLTPGLGSHGRMGSQVVNHFSLNILGGYTAGVNGFELGSLFNIVQKDMKYVEIGGLFNIVGGNAYGVQVGGLYNSVLDSASGIQLAGLANIVARDMKGIQFGGLYNHAFRGKGIQLAGLGSIDVKSAKGIMAGGVFNSTQHMNGVQLAGVANVNVKKTKGVQVAGVVNLSAREMNGLQLSGLVNITKALKGVQIGLVNIADTSEGYSIGLLNIIRKGYHKLSVSTSEMQHIALAYKSGNSHLYSILVAGMQLNQKQKAYAAGYGLGSDLPIGNKGLFINPELTHQYIYAGNDDQQNLLNRLQLHLKYRLGKYCYLYAGPAFSVLYRKQHETPEGYRSDFINGYPAVSFSSEVKGWLGWTIGVDLL